ncbi:MAG: hypothetical protein ACRCZL_05470, partial [Cetobacterium sp.]
DAEFKAIEGFNEAWIESKGVEFDNVCEIRTRDLDLMYILLERFTKGHPIPKLDENDKVINGEFELDSEGNPFVADAIVLDSISVIHDLLIEGRTEIVKKRTNIKIAKDGLFGDEKDIALENMGLQFLDYAKLKTKALKMVRDLQTITGKHVFFVSRAKDAKESKLVNGKMEQIDLGYEIMDATSFKFLPYEVSLIVHTQLKNGVVTYTIEKDSTGVNEQGKVTAEFDMKDYESYINNVDRTELLKTKTYEQNLEKAKMFADDTEDTNDVKLKMYNLIIGVCKTEQNKGGIVKKYCVDRGLVLSNPDLISVDDLAEMKKLIGA